ncbi:glycosyltransferase [Pseudoalteromonas sp. RB2-MNA-CIBAN-0110]|uniref:glycosyltransferase n=1 Tax=Pseudoalteromonas sp. RB2-MNA-CIBAN-0110 TaxID=3140439 RepID=UPI003329EB00
MNQNDLVSIYIPTHNRCELLKRAIDSVLNQSYSNVELIIVNDGSSDSTKEYLDTVLSQDCRVKVVNLPSPSGACNARNIAIKQATGTFITGLDDDDYFLFERIERFIEKSYLLKKYSFISSATVFFHDLGSSQKVVATGFNSLSNITLKNLSKYNVIGNQVFTYTERLKYLGGFEPKLAAWQDYDLWLRLVEEYGPGRNIFDESYYMDLSPQRSRISTSEKKLGGIRMFLRIHKDKLSFYTISKFNAFLYSKGKGKFNLNPVFIMYLILYKLKGAL